MNPPRQTALNPFRLLVLFAAGIFFAACTWVAWSRWANFEYRTFDVAFYIQALWQFLRGRFHVSLLNVPMLGNHADPVVFLFAPLFALIPHPMLLPVIQIAALAAMAPVGWRICRRLGMGDAASALMASALLLAPATGYVALHEFHPEAFAALFLLLMIEARLRDSLRWHWIWFLATLSCKENMTLLLAAYCAVEWVADRKHRASGWNLLPGIVALGWFLLYGKIIGPMLNSGNVEFSALYNHLGNSPADIVLKLITEPHRALGALRDSLTHGNLVWGLLLPFLGLPLLRPRWLLVAAPILFQHLLSWRTSEWTIYFHYAAPLIPLFWIAAAEAVRKWPTWVPVLVVAACLAGQFLDGPVRGMHFNPAMESAWKSEFLAPIPQEAAVVAPLPALAHLAMREKLYSLHHILKGLKTLSHSEYAPPQGVDVVVVDYADSATFDPVAGYYHPQMRTVDGRIFPSSDRLLHEFLRQEKWTVESVNEMSLFRRGEPKTLPPQESFVADLDAHTRLVTIEKLKDDHSRLFSILMSIRLVWSFHGEREVFPWMILRLKNGEQTLLITKGLCAPEAGDDGLCHEEIWHVAVPSGLTPGHYELEAVFVDNCRMAWARKSNPALNRSEFELKTVPIGSVEVGER